MTAVAKRDGTHMETYSGRFVDLLDPQPEQICLADIAVGLANACRFGNQVSRFYSVAEHSVRCCERVRDSVVGPSLERAALLHDAHEAYTCDITAPMKATLELAAPGVLAGIQQRLDIAIGKALGVTLSPPHPVVKAVDDEMLFREAAGLKYSHGIGEHWGNDEYYEPLVAYGWSPAEAERRFLEAYECCAPRS